MDDPVLVRADHREVGSGVPELLDQIPWVRLQVERLELADYILAPTLAVERKSVGDLAASIVDRRLFNQVERLQREFPRVVFIVEGESVYAAGNLQPNALRGAVSYLIVLKQVSLLHTEDAEDTAWYLATMARQAQRGLGYEISYHASRYPADLNLKMRYLVEDLPGIGPKTANALLAHFGSLRALFTANEQDLRQVPGVGAKRAAQLCSLVTRRYALAEPDDEKE